MVELNLPLSTLDKINKVVKKIFKDTDIAKKSVCLDSLKTGSLCTLFLSHKSQHQPQPLPKKRGKLKKLFASRTNQLICKFLVEALEPFDAINTELQSDASKIHLLQQLLDKLIKQLMVRFIQPAVFQRGGILSNLEKENLLQSSHIIIGKAGADFLAQEKS